MPHALYTIGYSTFSPAEFLKTLKQESVGAIVDVRSMPETSHFEAYRKGFIKKFLNDNGIYYVPFSAELGARPTSPDLYSNNRADFNKIAVWPPFLDACKRIRNGLEKFPICLMCAQKDPLNCHRAILVARRFNILYPELSISHFTSSDNLETQKGLEARLLKSLGYDQGLLSAKTHAQMLEEAYYRQELVIAWRKDQ